MKMTIVLAVIIVLIIATPIKADDITLLGRWANCPCKTAEIDGMTAYIGNGGNLDVLDITNPVNPAITGSVLTEGVIKNIEKDGNYLYVSLGTSGVSIYDVSVKSDPVLTSVWNTTGANITRMSPQGVTVGCVDTGANNVRFLNVSNPQNPTLLSSYKPGTIYSSIRGLTTYENKAFVAYFDYNVGYMDVVDVTNPSAPSKLGTCSIPMLFCRYGNGREQCFYYSGR